MRKNLILCFGFLIFLSGIFSANAETALTGNDIQNFISAMKPLQELSAKYNIQDEDSNLDTQNSNMSEFAPFTLALEKMKKHKAYEEFQSIIGNAGFSSVEKWADVGNRILRAFIASKMKQNLSPEDLNDMQIKMQEIKDNAYLSPEMKKQLLDSINKAIVMARPDENNTADQETMAPYLPQLERLFEDQK